MHDSFAFVENFERFSELAALIRHELPEFGYSFMDNAEFQQLDHTDLGPVNRIYVQELLFRAHWTALTAITRNRRWMHGMDAAMKHPNYFSFCANLRGFLESAADAHDALRFTAATLAEHFATFREALHGRFHRAMISCGSLEDLLIHYTHGRRVGKREQAPVSHRAKTMQDYLAALDDPRATMMRDLYAELCEITHPAAATVHFFGRADENDQQTIRFVDPDDMAFIARLIARRNDVFAPLFQKSFNSALLTLHILNRYNDPRLFTPGAEQVDFAKVPAMVELQQKMTESEQALLVKKPGF